MYRPFSPSGRVPCLVDEGWAVWDSLAIVEYLAERHHGVWPVEAKARAWARSAAAEMHSSFTALRNLCPMSCGLRVEPFAMPDALKHDLFRLDDLWNDGLTRFGGPFLAGDHFTAVDAFFAPVAFRAQSYGLSLRARPRPIRRDCSTCRRCVNGMKQALPRHGANQTMRRKSAPPAPSQRIFGRRRSRTVRYIRPSRLTKR